MSARWSLKQAGTRASRNKPRNRVAMDYVDQGQGHQVAALNVRVPLLKLLQRSFEELRKEIERLVQEHVLVGVGKFFAQAQVARAR